MISKIIKKIANLYIGSSWEPLCWWNKWRSFYINKNNFMARNILIHFSLNYIKNKKSKKWSFRSYYYIFWKNIKKS